MTKELMELIKSIVNKCVDERTSIDNDEASLVEKEWDILSIVQAPKTWYQRTMNRADIEDLYGDDEPNICFAEGFDEAIAGVVWDGERTRVVYDTELILELLMGRSEMSYEEAVEYFDYNIAGSYMGEYTPLYLET